MFIIKMQTEISCFKNIIYKNTQKKLLIREATSRMKSRISLKKILKSQAVTIITYHLNMA